MTPNPCVPLFNPLLGYLASTQCYRTYNTTIPSGSYFTVYSTTRWASRTSPANQNPPHTPHHTPSPVLAPPVVATGTF